MQKGEIQIYQTDTGTDIQVILDNESIWLDAHLMANLFNVNRPAVVKHIQNILKSSELVEKSTCSILEQVAADGKKRKMNLYNLDMIISVGYRVNSKEATQFRQWATQRLKDYLVKGYSLNEKRLLQLSQNLQQLEAVVKQIQLSGDSAQLQLQEAKGLLEVLSNYTKSFVLLNQYDSNKLQTGNLNEQITYEIEYNEAKKAVVELKKQLKKNKESSDLFGNEKDESFKSSLSSIVQTFDGRYLYPSIEEQAANLLYFVIQNHSFTDGNKRIGAFLFVWFLEKNKHRFKSSGELKINDNGLTAIALLVAQSKPEEKEIIIQLVVSLIADSK